MSQKIGTEDSQSSNPGSIPGSATRSFPQLETPIPVATLELVGPANTLDVGVSRHFGNLFAF